MTPEQQQALQEHIQAIAKILTKTLAEQLTTLAGIEQAVRNQMQKHVMLWGGVFFVTAVIGTSAGHRAPQKHSLENCLNKPTSPTLRVPPHNNLSYSELCCLLRVSATVSYRWGRCFCLQVSKLPLKPAAVSARQTWDEVNSLSKSWAWVRFASALLYVSAPGKNKGVRLHDLRLSGHFQDNDAPIEVNHPTACPTNHLV